MAKDQPIRICQFQTGVNILGMPTYTSHVVEQKEHRGKCVITVTHKEHLN